MATAGRPSPSNSFSTSKTGGRKKLRRQDQLLVPRSLQPRGCLKSQLRYFDVGSFIPQMQPGPKAMQTTSHFSSSTPRFSGVAEVAVVPWEQHQWHQCQAPGLPDPPWCFSYTMEASALCASGCQFWAPSLVLS